MNFNHFLGQNIWVESALGTYMYVPNGALTNGTNVATWSHDAKHQANLQWQLRQAEAPGFYYLGSAMDSRFVVHSSGATHNDGANITLWQGAPQHQNTQVRFADAGNGQVYIHFRHSDKCAHVHGATTQNDSNVSQWSCVNQANLKWRLVPTTVVQTVVAVPDQKQGGTQQWQQPATQQWQQPPAYPGQQLQPGPWNPSQQWGPQPTPQQPAVVMVADGGHGGHGGHGRPGGGTGQPAFQPLGGHFVWNWPILAHGSKVRLMCLANNKNFRVGPLGGQLDCNGGNGPWATWWVHTEPANGTVSFQNVADGKWLSIQIGGAVMPSPMNGPFTKFVPEFVQPQVFAFRGQAAGGYIGGAPNGSVTHPLQTSPQMPMGQFRVSQA